MTFIETFEESVSVLRVNRMRTLLSILGIVIGIGSVIALMALGEASQKSVTQRIQSLGSNLLIIRPGSQQQGFLRSAPSQNTTLTYKDVQDIKSSKRITTISDVSAEYSSRFQVAYERNNTNVQVVGVTANYFQVRNIEVETGRVFETADIDNFEKVAIIGPTVSEDLFGKGVNPLGQNVRIGGTAYRIVGVTKEKGQTGFGNSDELVYVSITTGQKVLFGNTYVSTAYAVAKDQKTMEAALNQVGFLLLELHGIKNVEDADFTITSQEDVIETISEVTKTFTTLLTGIAAISLVVGGIGIMNIMLVTVTERTREVGLRKSLGAKKRAIISQFLMEAVILTLIGGLIGVILGLGVSIVVTKKMGLPNVISLESIFLSVGVATVIGILFGWYPARKASNLQPIEALRYE